VGIVGSLAPIIVCFLGYLFLGESMFFSDALFLALVFASFVIVIVGEGRSSQNSEPEVIEVIDDSMDVLI
jgi:drug/metabolite transporter (DMT)-like permease